MDLIQVDDSSSSLEPEQQQLHPLKPCACGGIEVPKYLGTSRSYVITTASRRQLLHC